MDGMLGVLQTAFWEADALTGANVHLDPGRSGLPVFTLEAEVGTQPDGVTGWLRFVCPLDRANWIAFVDAFERVPAPRALEYRMVLANGELLWVRHWLLERVERAGQPRHRGALTAIPAEKRLEWECLRVSERERSRVGQELHDDLCQVLTGLGYMLQVLARRVTSADPRLQGDFSELSQQIVGALERTRCMAHGLFPAKLQDTTVREALQHLAQEMKTRFELAMELEAPPELPHHSPEQVVQVFRVVQEAASNAVKHGAATALRVAMEVEPGRMRVSVIDNGSGFPVEAARSEGIGLHIMNYRARMLGGTLTLNNGAGKGAVVRLEYPVNHDSTAVILKGKPAGTVR